jgi:alpha-beta hydrolase superfamily lysophospholipase
VKKLFACLLLLAGCPSIGGPDPGEGSDLPPIDGPTVEFDPASSIIPFPNNLVLDPTTGKVNLPAQACESPTAAGIRTTILDSLDGFGAYESGIQVTFTDEVDMTTLGGNVLLYERLQGATALAPAGAMPINVLVTPATTLRFTEGNCTSPATINAVNILALNDAGTAPRTLDSHSTYFIALLAGIKDKNGDAFLPSFTWGLVRNSNDPVTLDDQGNVTANKTPINPADPTDANGNGIPDTVEQLRGIDLLWKAHAQALAFLDAAGHADRSQLLVAFEFTTQTTTDPLDPKVATSPAAVLLDGPLQFSHELTCGTPGSCTAADTQAFLHAAFVSAGAGTMVCQADGGPIPCQAVGQVYGGLLTSQSYQTPTPNPLGASFNDVPGPWSDPITPAKVGTPDQLQTVIFVPAGPPNTPAMPVTGWPVVVFGHGLTRSKNDLAAIAPQLAQQGFASIAIDWVDHGSRAIQISKTAECAGSPDPSTFPECFALFLSTDLAGTRDNIRQSVLDLQQLVKSIHSCGVTSTSCGNPSPSFDDTHISYMGQSLGGIIGTTGVSLVDDFKSAVLNVPGVGLLDILENTDSTAISCTLVNALIAAGVLTGTPDNPANPTGICSTRDWQMQPGYQQFRAIGRWVVDPADGANFTPHLATPPLGPDSRKFLIQEVIGDHVVPNIACNNEGNLVGLTAATADPAISATPAPSAAILSAGLPDRWVQYPTLPADAANSFPGNTFAHGSLLQPADAGLDGALGTVRMQTDAITFLVLNH